MELEDIIYCVREKRVVHLPIGEQTSNSTEIWARPGDFIHINHPLLHRWMKGQESKVTRFEKLPKDASFVSALPMATSRLIQAYDRKNRASKASATSAIAIDSKLDEIIEQNKVLIANNERLQAENKALKLSQGSLKRNEQKTPF